MKASECLTAAKVLIANGENPWICNACNVVDNWRMASSKIQAGIEADLKAGWPQLAIPYQLGDTYSNWLKAKLGYRLPPKQQREARLHYMDALINYYQRQGD